MVAVSDAVRRLPSADVLYSCDAAWWQYHNGIPGFDGERWSTHEDGQNHKYDAAARFGLNLVAGRSVRGFSVDPAVIHYGQNSGFQAVNFAILSGACKIVLVGFDLRNDRPRHFFGDHPPPLRNSGDFAIFRAEFEYAAGMMPPGVTIINATPGSGLTCFKMMDLDDALADLTVN